MDLYRKIIKRPFIFKQLTGLEIQEFWQIIKKIKPLWKKKYQYKKKVSGRPYGLVSIENHLVCLLLYYRCYTTQLFIGFLFSLDDATISRSIRRLEPILVKVIAIKKERSFSEKDMEKLIIDATEQRIQRPKKKQKKYYSGKKKQHTIKTEIQINGVGRIVNISKPYPGKNHDIAIRKLHDRLPRGSLVLADSGYQGLQETYKNIRLPIKGYKNKPLNLSDKAYNKELSSARVPVEHKIRELKIFKIIGQTYRNSISSYSLKMNIVAGLVNFKHGF
jgi:hypothetical protein